MITKVYIQPYLALDIDNNLMDKILNKPHYDVIRLINLYLGSLKIKKTCRINCYLHVNNIDTTVDITGNILTINTSYIKDFNSIELIVEFYCYILKLLDFSIDFQELLMYVRENINKNKITFSNLKKNKFYSCEIFFSYGEINELLLGVNIYDKQNNLLKEILFMSTPVGVVINDIINKNVKKITWVDQENIKISKPNNIDYWIVNINGQVDFFYDRAQCGDAHGQYDLALMYKQGNGVLKKLEMYKFWINHSASQNYKRAIELLKSFESKKTS